MISAKKAREQTKSVIQNLQVTLISRQLAEIKKAIIGSINRGCYSLTWKVRFDVPLDKYSFLRKKALLLEKMRYFGYDVTFIDDDYLEISW